MTDTTIAVPKMTHAEWLDEGERRFGTSVRDWKFVCPICKGVQSFADFDALGVPLDTIRKVVNFSCVGRWMPDAPEAFAMGRGKAKRPRPTPETHCNYTLGGLFGVPGVLVEFEGKEVASFAFAEERHV